MKSRNLAYKVLFDIEKNQNYSNMAINKHFKDCNLDNRDRGFATEIIYGVVENKIYLDYIIDKLSKIKSNKLNLKVKILLRMGIYQILFLDSVSDYAAVNETVNLTKKLDNRSAGFVNAVLRNVIRQKEDIGEVKIKDTVDNLATKYSYNKWIVRNWISNFGREFTEDLLEANTERPSIYLRVNTLKTTRDELIKLLEEQEVNCEKVPFMDEAIKVNNLKNIENNELYKKGLFTVQDISSMLVGKILNPQKDTKVLDVCSAPGGKTTHIATLMENSGQVISRDIFEHKIKLIQNSVNRLGLKNIDVQLFDALNLDKDSIDKFDSVLADVPCSGLGIIKRKPEIKYKEKEEIKDLPKLQKQILQNAAKYVKVGGTLIYSTCTIQDDENIEVVESFLQSNKRFQLEKIENINIDLNQETLSNTTNLPLEEIVKTLNLEEDKVVTKDNIDKLLTVLCDKDGNEIKKDKFIEVVDSSKGESKKDTSQGVEMLKMVFNIDKSNGEQKGEEDILAKLMTMDEDINKVEDYIVEDTPIFTEVLNSKNDVASSLISEVKPVTVSRETVATDVVSNVKYMVKNQVEQLTVKIYPKELGEITIKIISEDGIMKADIKSTSKETYTLLNSNMEEIKKHLSNESLIIKEVNIGLYEDTTYYSGQGFSNEFNDERNKENYSVEDNDSINIHKEENEEISEEISNVNLLA